MLIQIKVLSKGCAPERMTGGSVGYDLRSTEHVIIDKGDMKKIPLGFSISIPPGIEGCVRARSSLIKKGLILGNGVGTIDNDYRGEVCAILVNLSKETAVIEKGERICQLVFNYVAYPELQEVEELDSTIRGSGGFGSTNKEK
jgi:dUTP pyrophosphatase